VAKMIITEEQYKSAMEYALLFEMFYDVAENRPEPEFFKWLRISEIKGITIKDKVKKAKSLWELSNNIITNYMKGNKK